MSVAQIQHLANDLPNHTNEIKAKVVALHIGDDSTLGRLSDMFDEVLIQALRRIRRERLAESISSSEEVFIASATKEIVAKAIETDRRSAESGMSASTRSQQFRVCGYPVHHESEEIALSMLQSLIEDDCNVTLNSTRQWPSKVITEITAIQPDVNVLVVIPPTGLPQVKYMCGELHARCPQNSILVACLANMKRSDELLVRLRKVEASCLTTSLQQTCHEIAMLKAASLPRFNDRESSQSVIVSATAST